MIVRCYAIALITACALALGSNCRPASAQTHTVKASAAPSAQSSTQAGTVDSSAPGLAAQQAHVADKYKELERLVLRMAEVMQSGDPKRAALLRQAFAQSKERQVNLQFEDLVNLLEKDQLYQAGKGQAAVRQDLNQILQLLLSGEREKQIPSERAQLKKFIDRINRLIREQQAVQGETEGQGEPGELAGRESRIADKTAELAGDVQKFDADRKSEPPTADNEEKAEKKPGESGKPSEPGKSGNKGDEKSAEKSGGDKPPSKDDAKGDSKSSPGQSKQGSDKQNSDKQGSEQKPADQSHSKSPDSPENSGDQPGEPSDGSSKSSGKPQQGKQSSEQQSGDGDDAKQSDQGSEESSPRHRIHQAEERMREAKRQLEAVRRRGAADEQQKAIEELKQAKAQLEEILRQLREEEVERVLVMLEARFRKMLQMQIEVYEGTMRLDRIPESERTRDVEMEAGKLGRTEAAITAEADKALALLREEGSSVAFPESVEQMREDMQQVATRLARANIGQITQGIEQDIVKSLEEMIAALQQAQKDQKQHRGGQQGSAGGDDDQALVDRIAELKMIRALQMRVNTRTGRYSRLLSEGVEQAEQPDLVEALRRLSEREERIYKTTHDIVVGRNR